MAAAAEDAPELPTFADVEAAAARLSGVAVRTPALRSDALDAATGARVWLKPESLQRVGAFKFRGAYNALARLKAAGPVPGVLAYSSGNHAQAVALAGTLLGIRTAIVMPADAPAVKLAATRAHGAEVIVYDRQVETREALAARLVAERGWPVVPPYDHADVIAGQGTAALELIEDVGPLEVLLVCVGGGGLIGGSALAAHARSPGVRVYGAEPAAADDAARSLATGVLQTVHNPDTIADGARTPSLGRLTFPLVRRDVAGILTVSDAELIAAMRWAALHLKLVLEPTGGLALALALSGRLPLTGSRVGVILSGGNVDLPDFARWIGGPL